MSHLQGGLVAQGRRRAEPAAAAAEVAIPSLVDCAPTGCPGPFLPQAVEAIRSLGVHATAEVVPEEPTHLQETVHMGSLYQRFACPQTLLLQAVATVRGLGIHAAIEVVPEEPTHLQVSTL